MKRVFFLLAAIVTTIIMMAQTPTVSVSSVTFKYCKTTSEIDVVTAKTGFPYRWQDSITFDEPGSYTILLTNVRGCDSILTLVLNEPTGEIPYEFSVSSSKKVFFSNGNLQFRASKAGVAGDLTHIVQGGYVKNGEWRFAPEQWFVVGQSIYGNTQTAWKDLFGWGCSGYNNTQPWTSSTSYNDGVACYRPSNGSDINFAATDLNYDWGYYNSIVNAGNTPGQWFTLTKEEWEYVIKSRSDASNKRGCATVNGVKGYILLPDAWTACPDGLSFTPNSTYAANTYSGESWTKMENAGAVFLPCAGYRYSGGVANSEWGFYYTATFAGTSHDSSYNIIFKDGSTAAVYYGHNGSSPSSYNNCAGYGMSVRLVKLAQ